MVSPNPADTATEADVHVPGQLNLSHDAQYRLTVEYIDVAAVTDNSNVLLRVLINNNTNTQGYSVLGNNSVLRHFTNVDQLHSGGASAVGVSPAGSEEGRLVVTFNPALLYAARSEEEKASLKTAFIALFTSNPHFMTITGISLEQLED